MSIAPENEAITWHDVAEQLTSAQTQTLLREQEPLKGASDALWVEERQREMLAMARCYARTNLFDALLGPLAFPDGAHVTSDWNPDESAMAYRFISGAERPILDEPYSVYSCACQFADGSIDDGLVEAPSVSIADRRVSLEGVRVLISALQECLDEIASWAAFDPSGCSR